MEVKQSRMRTALPILLVTMALSCRGPERPPDIDRIELRLSGWSAVEIQVNRRGEGRYHLSEPLPNGRSGDLALSPQQFTVLVERLRPFQQNSVPLTQESVREHLDDYCPKGAPQITDAGGVWVHWTGSGYDRHYVADFGCDYERNRARNDELKAIIGSLPIPSER